MYMWNKVQPIESDINFDENDKMRRKKVYIILHTTYMGGGYMPHTGGVGILYYIPHTWGCGYIILHGAWAYLV